MKSIPPAALLRSRKTELVKRWMWRFARNRESLSRSEFVLDQALVASLFEEVVELLGPMSHSRHIPRLHDGMTFAQMADFPESVTLCIEVLQAGAQVIGAFLVEHAGPTALWSLSARNRHLGELDAVFHILVHREIEALCELCLHQDSTFSDPGDVTPSDIVSILENLRVPHHGN